MNRKFARTAVGVILLLTLGLRSMRSETPNVQQTSISPDKKWEYRAAAEGEGPRIVKAGTKEMVGDLSDDCDSGSCGEGAAVLWAPDSRRLAFNWGQGRERHTKLYQLRGDKWEVLKTPGDGDEILKRAQDTVKAQVKKAGVLKKMKNLHELEWTVRVDRWVDPNTAILYASQRSRAERNDASGEREDLGYFGAAFLFTLKFDEAGTWKVIKTHEMSDKELEKYHQRD